MLLVCRFPHHLISSLPLSTSLYTYFEYLGSPRSFKHGHWNWESVRILLHTTILILETCSAS